MAIPLPLEIVAAIAAGCLVLGMLRQGNAAVASSDARDTRSWSFPTAVQPWLKHYLLTPGWLASVGLLALRLAVGVMMIHHGQDKLADPQSFATNYVAALHLPFPLVMAYAAGYAEIIGSWLVIFGLFTPLGALALSGTMAVAGYHHILTSGLNIYVLELVVLYLGGSVGLLLMGPGRISFDAGIARELLALSESTESEDSTQSSGGNLIAIPVDISAR
jgi:putative oxidoreductase